ncbi:hypothetical protein F5Y12DRAFT_719251 [Xylaria sp. FL1777]|nr:hypothetical protein F5Y12DRAFT_719251 [Xylaria sp. FL1777]
MLTPVIANIISYFYPIGNTPAVSLTQTIPPGEPVDILLLGCGDVRNILFTSCVDAARVMDITCCDNQKAILARNILLLSLLIDGNDSSDDLIWSLYYHMSLDSKSLELLRSQAQKLHDLSTSMDTWQQSKYSSRLRFCDTATLQDVRVMWAFYAIDRRGAEAKRLKLRLDGIVQQANAKKKGLAIGTSYRSMIPAAITSMPDLSALHSYYWKHGTLELDAKVNAEAKFPNPMFLTLDDEAAVHYGTDPLVGFHLALACVPLEAQNPLSQKLKGLSGREKIVFTAKAEFRDWAASYRKQSGNITLRFITADASNLALTMHQKCCAGTNTAGLYRQQYDSRPLVLDGPDYVSGKAPLTFDVIDTSNLCDHFGSLVLFAATAPLLRNSMSSVLYAEVIVKLHQGPKEILDNLLCGHVATMSSILGLFPIDYWTNTSPLSVFDEELPNTIGEMVSEPSRPTQMYLRTRWKRPAWLVLDGQKDKNYNVGLPKIYFKEEELAHIMYDVYLRMFRDEDYKLKFANMSLQALQTSALVWYHRASFASVVHLFKTRVVCDWDKTITALMDLVEGRPNAPMGMNYIQELFIYLHIFGTHSNVTLLNWHQRHDMIFSSLFSFIEPRITPIDETWGDLRDWKEIPSVVCVTLKVPRSALRTFTKIDRDRVGTPSVHCALQDSDAALLGGRQNIFPACHLTFGDVTTKGEKYTDSFEVHVQAASGGWGGSASLIVSFHVPTFFLLYDPRKTEVVFGIHSTPVTVAAFLTSLGLELSIYKTTLDNDNNVFITRYSPGQTRFPAPPGFAEPRQESVEGLNEGDTNTSLTAQANNKGRIVSMATRVELKSDNYKSALKNNCKVQTSILSASQVGITLGEEPSLAIGYPVLVEGGVLTTKLACEPHSIEFLATVGTSFGWERHPNFMYPVHLQKGGPVNWNLTYLDIQKCPIIDVNQSSKLEWLNMHVAGAMSGYERKMRQNANLPRSVSQKTRLDFKESIFSIFVQFAGIQGIKSRVFALDNPGNGGIHIIILVSNLRFDLATRAVVLDCAVLPLYDEIIPKLPTFLGPLSHKGLISIRVNNEELRLWKHVLPAYVERCREWPHRDDCEYATAGRVPLALELGTKLICTCGDGKFPDDFIRGVPNWSLASKYAVRAAISPPFWAPFADETNIPAMARSSNTCGTCGKTKGKNGKELLTCSRCKKQKYCSPECQRANWPFHKGVCKSPSA